MSDSAPDDGGSTGESWTEPMSASFTETTHTSFWQRALGALFGILIGLVLIPASGWLLFWNEGRAVQTARSLTEGGGAVVSAPADRVDPALEGRLVYVSAPLTASSTLKDPEFGVAAPNAIRLVRRVEMYQWRERQHSETRTRVGGGQETVTTYSYSREWSSSAIDSNRFRQIEGHRNPPMNLSSREFVATNARLGPYVVSEEHIQGFGNPQRLAPDPSALTDRPRQQVIDGQVFVGDPAAPQVGDLRITFSLVPSGPASLIAQQAGEGFAPYQTHAGDRLFLLRPGTLPPEAMIQAAEQFNQILTWILRAAGLVVMFLGFMLIFGPLSVFASVIPPLGALVGFAAGLAALLLTALFGPLVIAVAWFAYRPLVGGLVLALGLAITFGVARLLKRRASAKAALPRTGGAATAS
ncbi:TMEM43 family protein [Sabulicella rubraurantiaca]|uniref:TMEM43 family protein n=1 Tax=Sabulicella rubraurantiaca TaxID=2811429 RepID=UPI001A959D35|nr:TMEM43 family protein [Sabulicella rubraurantiaca]